MKVQMLRASKPSIEFGMLPCSKVPPRTCDMDIVTCLSQGVVAGLFLNWACLEPTPTHLELVALLIVSGLCSPAGEHDYVSAYVWNLEDSSEIRVQDSKESLMECSDNCL